MWPRRLSGKLHGTKQRKRFYNNLVLAQRIGQERMSKNAEKLTVTGQGHIALALPGS